MSIIKVVHTGKNILANKWVLLYKERYNKDNHLKEMKVLKGQIAASNYIPVCYGFKKKRGFWCVKTNIALQNKGYYVVDFVDNCALVFQGLFCFLNRKRVV